MKQTLLYSLKLWVTTIILSIFWLSLINPYAYKSNSLCSLLEQFFWATLAAVVAFSPLLFFTILIVAVAKKKRLKKIFLGCILTSLTMVNTLIVGLIIYQTGTVPFDAHSILFVSIFPLIMGVSIWFYKDY